MTPTAPSRLSGPLNQAELRRLLAAEPPLVEDLLDPERQLTPNGVDLSIAEVAWPADDAPAVLDFTNAERRLPAGEIIPWREDRLLLPPGPYLVRYAERVNLPDDVIALGKPRSSLFRCGAELVSAVWDAGYSGRGQGLLVVHYPGGLTLTRRARVLQLVFFRLTGRTAGYDGNYQNEDSSHP
jgi:dUTP pyrophosphatase